jgi:proline dehydrogenase
VIATKKVYKSLILCKEHQTKFKMLNQVILKTLPLMPKELVFMFAKKYISGAELITAVDTTKSFAKLGGKTTIDVLGEFVTTKERALHEKSMSLKVIEAINEYKLDTYLSIKPTSLGLGIDYNFGFNNIFELVKLAKEYGQFVRFDMENSPYTTLTLQIYKDIREKGYDNCGVVIQAYMRRSYDDIKELLPFNPSIRLCKGIYVEDEKIAFKGKEEIRDNYKLLLDMMLENNVKSHIATHDDDLIFYAEKKLKELNYNRDNYEFEMLLGVRENRRNDLLKRHNVRIYVPFGEDWYGYSVRRLNENPNMAGQIFKSLFFKN